MHLLFFIFFIWKVVILICKCFDIMLLSFMATMDYEFMDLWTQVKKSSSQSNTYPNSCVQPLIWKVGLMKLLF